MSRSPLPRTLVGENRGRSLASVGVAVALFLCAAVLGPIASEQGTMNAAMERVDIVVIFTVVVGGVLAGANAYWNDGLGLSWLLVFAPTVAWLWIFFDRGFGTPLDSLVADALGFSLLATLVVGTLGYAVGISLRRSRTGPAARGVGSGGAEGERGSSVERALLGRRRGQLTWWLLFAGVLSVIAFEFVAFAGSTVLGTDLSPVGLFYVLFAVSGSPSLALPVILCWVGLAAWPAYRADGFFAAWALLFGPMFGGILNDFVTDSMSGGGAAIDAALALIAALIFSLILGTAGFVVGTLARRVIPRWRPPSLE